MAKRRKKNWSKNLKKSPNVKLEPPKPFKSLHEYAVSDSFLKTGVEKFKGTMELFDFTNSAWGFNENFYKRDWCSEILPKLNSREEDTWKKIANEHNTSNNTKHHHIDISRIIKVAQKRLTDLNLDDSKELYSFRLDGKKRLYGILDYPIFKIVWYDSKHEVYPLSR